MLLAELDHFPNAGDGQARFQRAGLVVEAGVEDAAVMAALMGADVVFLFQHGDARVGKAPREFAGRGKADDAAADDDEALAGYAHTRVG